MKTWPEGTPLATRASAVFVVEYLVWWHQWGNAQFGKGTRAHRINASTRLTRHFALVAVKLVGGWREARVLLKGWPPTVDLVEVKAVRGIRLRE